MMVPITIYLARGSWSIFRMFSLSAVMMNDVWAVSFIASFDRVTFSPHVPCDMGNINPDTAIVSCLNLCSARGCIIHVLTITTQMEMIEVTK